MCPAYGKMCWTCGKYDHFASVCRASEKRYKNVNDISMSDDSETEESDSDYANEFIKESVRHLGIVKENIKRISDLNEQDEGVSSYVDYSEPDITVEATPTDFAHAGHCSTPPHWGIADSKKRLI